MVGGGEENAATSLDECVIAKLLHSLEISSGFSVHSVECDIYSYTKTMRVSLQASNLIPE